MQRKDDENESDIEVSCQRNRKDDHLEPEVFFGGTMKESLNMAASFSRPWVKPLLTAALTLAGKVSQ